MSEAASNAIAAFGTILSVSVDGGTTFTAMAEVKDINGPKMKGDTYKTTQQNSPGKFHEYIATTADAGEMSFDVNFIPATGTTYQGYLTKKYQWRLTFTDEAPTTFTSDGILTGVDIKSPLEAGYDATMTVKLSGKPVWAS